MQFNFFSFILNSVKDGVNPQHLERRQLEIIGIESLFKKA